MTSSVEKFFVRLEKHLADDKPKHHSNTWLTEDAVSLYIRLTDRTIYGKHGMFSSIDLATIDVADPIQGQGIFKRIVDVCLMHPFRQIVYVESVVNPRFTVHFKRHRSPWESMPYIANSYYRPTNIFADKINKVPTYDLVPS